MRMQGALKGVKLVSSWFLRSVSSKKPVSIFDFAIIFCMTNTADKRVKFSSYEYFCCSQCIPDKLYHTTFVGNLGQNLI